MAVMVLAALFGLTSLSTVVLLICLYKSDDEATSVILFWLFSIMLGVSAVIGTKLYESAELYDKQHQTVTK